MHMRNSPALFGGPGPFLPSDPPDIEDRLEIFDAIDRGLCVVEVIFDDRGIGADYIFRDANSSFTRLTGIDDPIGKSMRSIKRDHEQHWFHIYGEIARTGEPKRFVAKAAALGRWYDVYAFRLGDAGANRVAILFEDITDRKRSEEHFELLRREVDHRTRNMLTVVSAVVQLTKADDVPDFKRRLLGRLASMHRSFEMLANSPVPTDFEAVIRSELAPYASERKERIVCSGPRVALSAEAVQSFAMALHELATNAVKHGSLSSTNGTVSVTWHVADGELRADWQESGGPTVVQPTRIGMGTGVIERCIRGRLGGEVAFEWASDGLRCRLIVPLT